MKNKWVPVKDRLPELNVAVLWFGCDPQTTSSGTRYEIDCIEKWETEKGKLHWWNNFIHWMPLPECSL